MDGRRVDAASEYTTCMMHSCFTFTAKTVARLAPPSLSCSSYQSRPSHPSIRPSREDNEQHHSLVVRISGNVISAAAAAEEEEEDAQTGGRRRGTEGGREHGQVINNATPPPPPPTPSQSHQHRTWHFITAFRGIPLFFASSSSSSLSFFSFLGQNL